ncbi:glycosyltransferase family 4 protein [Clostridium hydrogenum]|uniref:glycosyltransferase family 4 protein n=1 Tax=Clostridium hydrogenum TaxID=2855764 RepID=UPI001F30758F|nr:glycosyltransferase family 4 protein [Clostridium hydrogenum]
MKKNLLIYAHYFYPDVASTGQILTELGEGIQQKFNVTVICVVPSYSGKIEDKYKDKRFYYEKYKEINVLRVRVPEFDKKNKLSRIKNILSYFFNAICATFKVGKQDVVFSISQPPILGGTLGVIGKLIKRAKFVYNIQDFNPEQTEAVGYAKNRFILNFARAVDKFSCRKSNMIVVVGRDMQVTLSNRFKGKRIPKSVVINNWIDEAAVYPLAPNHDRILAFKKKYNLENKYIVMYSGNLGLYYDLENIVETLSEFKGNKDIAFAFVGDGSVKSKLMDTKNRNNLDNVYFIPYQNKEDLIYSLNAADVHLVINAKGIKGVSVPSKLYGVMASGKPVLGVLESGSEARMVIEDAKCGVCNDVGDYEGFKKTIKFMFNNKAEYIEKGLNGRQYLENKLKRELSIGKYSKVISELVQ